MRPPSDGGLKRCFDNTYLTILNENYSTCQKIQKKFPVLLGRSLNSLKQCRSLGSVPELNFQHHFDVFPTSRKI